MSLEDFTAALLSELVFKIGEDKEKDEEDCIQGKFRTDKHLFWLFHNFRFPQRLSEDEEEKQKEERGDDIKGLEFEGIGEIQKRDEADDGTRRHPEE